MRLVLQVKPGGRKIWLSQGQNVRVGRTDEADFVVPDDEELSDVHFAVWCGTAECFVQDLGGGGTFHNGERVSVAKAALRDGDEIRAGQTKFAVQIQASPMDSHLITPELQAKLAAAQTADFDLSSEESEHQDETGGASHDAARSQPQEVAGEPAPAVNSPPGTLAEVVVEVTSGTGDQRLLLHPGERRSVGSTHWADFPVEGDERMAEVHFVVKCESNHCVVRNIDSAHDTYVNGQRINQAPLADGDQITAGGTTFSVHIPDERSDIED
jgi:pSer/pThr/pTyr-binding forkhead associated (FHA) protein